MPYRDDLAALRAREEALGREVAGKQQELDEIRKTIDGLKPRFRLRVASPCTADWSAMQGDDRVRFCGQCEKNVYNISAMTHAEAEDLIREKEGKLCVRFYQRTDGTVLTADCPWGRRRRRRRHIVMMAGAAAGLLVAAGFVSFTRGRPHFAVMGAPVPLPPPVVEHELMGDISEPTPPVEVRGQLARPRTTEQAPALSAPLFPHLRQP